MAAILAAAVAAFTLGAVVLWTELDKKVSDVVFAVGKAWMPHAQEVGPYSGKETVTAVVWLASWLVLHLALRKRHINPKPWFALALLLLLAGILGIWPPVWHAWGA
jgi:hypothetical protein